MPAMTRRPLPQWLGGILATLATLSGCAESTAPLRPDNLDPTLAKGGGGPAITVAALPGVPGYPAGGTMALDINVAGTIVGAGPDATGSTGHATRWTMTAPGLWMAEDLDFLLPGATRSLFSKVNAAGMLLGSFITADDVQHDFVWSPGGGLTVFDAEYVALDLSDADEVVGHRINPSGPDEALYWLNPSSVPEVLPPLIPGEAASAALAPTGDGMVVGVSGNKPVRWTRAAGAWSVALLSNERTYLTGRNPAGRLVGSTCIASPCGLFDRRAVVFDSPYSGAPFHLVAPKGTQTDKANDVSAAGLIVGEVVTKSWRYRLPAMWSSPSSVTLLPLLPNQEDGWARAVSTVNNRTLVVGGGMGAVVWALP